MESELLRINDLVSYLQDIKKQDPEECEKIIELMADYHIESNPTEEKFWNNFLLAWKKDMS